MKLKLVKKIINFSDRKFNSKSKLYGCYPHIVKNKIYWQSIIDGKLTSIEYANNPFEKTKIPENNIALKDSLAAQNFRVFYDTNPNINDSERWKAIGGYHVGRSAIKNINPNDDIYKRTLHSQLQGCTISPSLSVNKIQDVVWSNETRLLFNDDFFHPRHANGFYIFKSDDEGVSWKAMSKKPILSVFSKCEGENVTLGSDNMPGIFYDPILNEYTVYLRCNIKLGVRNVLVTTSKDLVNWKNPKLINKDPSFDTTCENLYYFDAYYSESLKTYIAFAPHFKNEILKSDGSQRRYYDAKTLVLMSKDKYNWSVVDETFEKKFPNHMTQKHIVTFVEHNNDFYLYVHEDWHSHNNFVSLYQIDSNYIKEKANKFKGNK
jgi:hypothetical protein